MSDELAQIYADIEELLKQRQTDVHVDEVLENIRSAVATVTKLDASRPDSGFEELENRSEVGTPLPTDVKVDNDDMLAGGRVEPHLYYNEITR